MEFKPPFIDVTYHREEFIYKKTKDGYYEKVAVRKRPGTVGICAAIINKYKVDACPHLICAGFSKQETENALIDLSYIGVENVLLLRGDARTPDGTYEPEPDGHPLTMHLIEQVRNMNQGKFLHEEVAGGLTTDFCIGVAGYPEKHYEALNLDNDIRNLKKKVDAGADYIVTQMFFDNAKYFQFVEKCREAGIHVPIIPGLKPITKLKQLQAIPRIFYVDFPEEFAREAEKAESNAHIESLGIEWLVHQCKELKKAGVPVLHFYTMGDTKTMRTVIDQIL